MAEIKCYKIHTNLSRVRDLNILVEKASKISNLMFDGDGNFAVWLNDDKDKKDLVRVLKNVGITEYFCEPLTYESIGKDKSYNFLSAWFMENYNAFLIREAETQNQSKLREMYENIQQAQEQLENIRTGATNASMKNNN